MKNKFLRKNLKGMPNLSSLLKDTPEPKSDCCRSEFWQKVGEFFPLNRDLNSFINKLNPILEKTFSNELSEYRQELKKKVEGMEKDDPWVYGFNVDMTAGYNQALSDVIKLLEE